MLPYQAVAHTKYLCALCGVVLKQLLAFPGSLYKEDVKTTSGTLVYRFERQTAWKKISSFKKRCVLDLERRILSQEPSAAFCILMSYFMESKLKKMSSDSWWRVNAVIIETV